MTPVLSLFLAWALAHSDASAQPKPYRFGVDVNAVLVDVYVGRRGQPLGGLTAGDFEVLDNGVRQDVELVEAESLRLGAVLVLDISRSVRGDRLDHLKDAGRAFLEGLAARDDACLVTFFHHVQRLSPWSRDRGLLGLVPGTVEGKGGTALHDAIYAGIQVAESVVERPMLLVFTDGQDLHSRLSEQDVIHAVEESSAVIYAVGIKPSVHIATVDPSDPRSPIRRSQGQKEFLHRIAEDSGGRFLTADSTADLKGAFLRVLSEMKDRYLLSYRPRGVPQRGWHSLEVKLRHHRAEIRARRGYYVAPARR